MFGFLGQKIAWLSQVEEIFDKFQVVTQENMDIRYTIQLCRTIATGIWVHSMNLSSKAFGMYLECISICLGLLIGILASAFCFLVILPIIFTLLFFVITFTLVILYLYSLDNEQNNHSADNNQDEYQLLQQNQPHDEGDNAPELFPRRKG